MNTTPNLALFPLSTVLFPGCRLDLQLFEARYLDMLGRCLKQGCGFGVVGIFQGQEAGRPADQFAQVGCEALIRDWQQRPNGLLGIRVEGGRRFRVLSSWVQADQLTCADVEWLDETPDQPVQDQYADLAALLQALAEQARARGNALPPGFRAQMALLHLQLGRDGEALDLIDAEKAAFPESTQYMDFVHGSIARK